MGQRVEGMPAFFNAGVPLQPLVSDTHHPCSATQWRTYYLPCRTSRAIVAHVNSQRTSSSFVDENILKKWYLVSDYQRRLSVWRWEMQWYTHTHTHVPDFTLWYGNHIHWQHNRDKCIRLHSEHKVFQREDDMGRTAAFLMDMHVLIPSQIMTREPHCSALWWQRTSVGSLSAWWQVRHGPLHTISRYMVSLQQILLSKMEFLYKIILSFSRLPRASKNPHDYSGAFPFHCVHRPYSAGRVEGTGVGPWPQRGGQVRGRAVKGEMADGKARLAEEVYNQTINHQTVLKRSDVKKTPIILGRCIGLIYLKNLILDKIIVVVWI